MKVKSIKKITDEKFMNMYAATYIDNDGNEKQWTFVSRNEEPVCMTGKHKPNAVVIVAYHTELNKLVLEKEYRIPIGNYEIGFPAGLIDVNESPADAAVRELFEETGLIATDIIKNSPPIYSSVGMSDESVMMVYVACKGESTTRYNEASEDIEVMLCSQEDVRDILDNGYTNFIGAKAWFVLVEFARTGKIF